MIITRVDGRTVRGMPDWEVEEHFPSHLSYREAERTLEISAERASGPRVSIILYHYPFATYWQPPHRGAPLTADEMHPHLVRMTAAVLLLGINPIWETDPVGSERRDWPVIMMEAQALLRRAE